MTNTLVGHVLYSQDHVLRGGQGGHVMGHVIDHVIGSHDHVFLRLLGWSWD